MWSSDTWDWVHEGSVSGDMAVSGSVSGGDSIPSLLQEAVLCSSQPMPADSVQVKGHDFSEAR